METVLHATRAAKSGSLDAGQALAQLTQTALLGGVSSMSSDAQSNLLMEVLQQVTYTVLIVRTSADGSVAASS
jgi:hypothetical protein